MGMTSRSGFAFALITLVVGCSSSTSTTDPAPKGTTTSGSGDAGAASAPPVAASPTPAGSSASTGLSAFATAFCTRLQQCPTEWSAGVQGEPVADVPGCAAKIASIIGANLALQGVQPDPSGGWTACAQSVTQEPSCDRVTDWKRHDACHSKPGSLPDGATCTHARQCAGLGCSEVCGAAAKLGESCAQFDCADGLQCDPDQKCISEQIVGEACDDSRICVNSECTAGTCQPCPGGECTSAPSN